MMFNHTGVDGYALFIERTESPFYYLYMSFAILSKVAVPVFFMISGALLLNKHESIRQVIKKRFLRIVLVLFIVSFAYYILFNYNSGFSLVDFVKTVYQSSVNTSLWYLYSYCGVLLMLPLLQKLAKAMSNSEFVYLICGYFIFSGIIPAFEFLFSKGTITLNPHFSVALFTTSNIVYVMTGYFLENRLSKHCLSKKNLFLLGAASFLAVLLTCVLTQLKIEQVGLSSLADVESLFNLFIIIPAISLFLITKGIFYNINDSKRIGKVITTLGSSVFGAYLVEKLVRILVSPIYDFLSPYVGSFLASVIWVLIGISISLLFITAIKKCPLINRFVNIFI